MCDCYYHKCNTEGCSQVIYIHLEGFNTKRSEIEVYCGTHMPKSKKDRKDGYVEALYKNRSKSRIFIKPLTENAWERWVGNSYNGKAELVEFKGKKADDKFRYGL